MSWSTACVTRNASDPLHMLWPDDISLLDDTWQLKIGRQQAAQVGFSHTAPLRHVL